MMNLKDALEFRDYAIEKYDLETFDDARLMLCDLERFAECSEVIMEHDNNLSEHSRNTLKEIVNLLNDAHNKFMELEVE